MNYIGTIDCEFPDYEKYFTENLDEINRCIACAAQFIPRDDFNDPDDWFTAVGQLAGIASFYQTSITKDNLPLAVDESHQGQIMEWSGHVIMQVYFLSLERKGLITIDDEGEATLTSQAKSLLKE